MPVHFHVSSVTFSDENTIETRPSEIIVLVGPNNSGKSATLRAINEKVRLASARSPVVSKISVTREGSNDELIPWISARSRQVGTDPTNPQYTAYGASTSLNNARAYWQNPQGGLHELGNWFCRILTAEARVTAANPANRINLLQDAPSHPIHVLEIDDRVEARLSKYFRNAFGADLIVNRGAGGSLPLMVGHPPQMKPGQDRVSFDYLRELAALPSIQQQGDGMRSFAGVLLNTFVGEEPVVLIDEPEAFLHPPQARILGRMLAQEKAPGRQMFIATHSSDIVRGLLEARNAVVRVIRIQRDRNVNSVRMLDNENVRSLWDDSLLRYSSILDGLFHERVVICESDSDCRFYAAVADAISERAYPARIPDIMYTHCGGKDRIPLVTRALRKVDVPVTVVADFDVFSSEHPLRSIVEAIGGAWSGAIESAWRLVKNSIDQKKPELVTAEVVAEIGTIMASVKEVIFPKAARSAIEQVLRRSSPWSIAKQTGSTYVPQGDPSRAVAALLDSLRNIGVFVVECGELERFVPSVGDHGPGWVSEVMKKDLASDPELDGARRFVARMHGIPFKTDIG